MNWERYDRQSLLPEIGANGQRRLARARVLCIGAGGLGCAALPYLAAAGVGHLTIMDTDRVELSNLQRQVLFREDDIGRPKAESAAERLRAQNSDIDIVGVCERLNTGNVQSWFEDHDVILDGSDNFATKYLASDAGVKFGVPVVYASAVGFEAQVTVLDPDQGPCLRCLFPDPPTGWVPNCAEAGVLGPLVGMAGCLQACEAIKLLVSEDRDSRLESLAGWLWLIDGRDMQTRRMQMRKKENCPCCSRRPEEIILADQDSSGIQDIAASELGNAEDVVLIDVREPDEWAREHIPGAINIPLSRIISGDFSLPDQRAPFVVYCARGTRGRTAAQLLESALQGEVKNLKGGLATWPGRREAR